MIKRLFQSKSNFFALLVFHLLFFVIVLTNFPADKWFIGWDSIHPEFNFALNFERALFAGWQGNYGVGTLTGHGFAALLPHTLITFLFSLVMPLSAIRPAFTLVCLYFGGLGLYFLVRFLLHTLVRHYHTHIWQGKQSVLDGIALLAGLYYLFNLATIQMFYLQLEAFIVHFAALPWLFLSVLYLLQDRSKKHIFFFIVVNFLATVQGFIPPLFVAYATALALFLLMYLISQQWKKAAIKSSILIVLFTFFINAYWFLPVAYFTASRGDSFLTSYNNLISTPEFVQKSQKFGDLSDVALLKGFYWDNYELGGPVLGTWISHNVGLISVFGYLMFGIAVVGFAAGLFAIRDWTTKAMSIVGLYFFANIAVATPPFSWIFSFLQWLSPTFEQAFRTTFTKFSLGTGFAYSILFAVGLLFLFTAIHRIGKYKTALYGTVLLFGIGLVWYALPLFQGNLFYNKLLITVPQSYFELMDYFKDKGDGRIADFPQDCPEGWYSYHWGYFGSGFLWYGIKQPILARSFDVWSPHNENYYWELMQAIREEDFARVENIFDKYDVKWILYDQNFIYCRDQKGVFTTADLIKYIDASPNYQLVKQFRATEMRPISVYERVNAAHSYVGTATDLPNIGPVDIFNDRDTAYRDYGAYAIQNKRDYDRYFPFDTLFSKRGSDQSEFTISATDNEIILKNNIPKELKGYNLRLPAYSDIERYIPVTVQLQHASGIQYKVLLTYQLPTLSLDGKALGNPLPTLSLGTVPIRDIGNVSVYVNNGKVEGKGDSTYTSAFSFQQQNTVHIVSATQAILFSWSDNQDPSKNKQLNEHTVVTVPSFAKGELQVTLPKIRDNMIFGGEHAAGLSAYIPQSCGEPTPSDRNKHEYGMDDTTEFVRMISQNSKQCLTIPLPALSTAVGYILEVTTRHISGGNLEFSVKNKDRPAGLDVYLSKDKKFATSYFIMPPTFASDIGYDFVFQNDSFTNEQMINDVSGVSAWYLPYNFLKNIQLERGGFELSSAQIQQIQGDHPNDILYSMTVDPSKGKYLLLSQGYDKGWIAFTSDLHLLSHQVLVNNWMNGWDISDLKNREEPVKITLIFLPQVLEFIGFVLLPLPFVYAFWPRKKKKE